MAGARCCSAEPAPAGLGTRSIDISRPGFALPEDFPAGATVPVGGALQPMRTGDGRPSMWPADAADAFQTALLPIVDLPATCRRRADGSDPLLAPPLYGRWHAGRPTASAAVDNVWFDELNADPRHRVIAALGTRVVQEHQEALMASAWEQAAELQRGQPAAAPAAARTRRQRQPARAHTSAAWASMR